MKINTVVFIILLTSLCSISCIDNREKRKLSEQYIEVSKVSDGDTFWVTYKDGTKEKVRLIGINAPESRKTGKKDKEYFGKESSDFLKSYLLNKKVRLEYDVQKTDRYKRTLAYVYMEDDTFLNDYLVKNGFASVATYPPNVKYVDLFVKSEQYARENKLGLWKK